MYQVSTNDIDRYMYIKKINRYQNTGEAQGHGTCIQCMSVITGVLTGAKCILNQDESFGKSLTLGTTNNP